jgi:Fur family transcriptional regulator, ferric uptake regulator
VEKGWVGLNDRHHLYDSIHQHGFRLTSQRQVILEAVLEGASHSTTDEVYQRVARLAPEISLATIYRGLNFLCELRRLVAADIGGGR